MYTAAASKCFKCSHRCLPCHCYQMTHSAGALNSVRCFQELSPPTQSSEYQTALEKSASLYDRVTALRNAATQKLESMRCESENYVTAADDLSAATDLSTTQYYQPVSSSPLLSLRYYTCADGGAIIFLENFMRTRISFE